MMSDPAQVQGSPISPNSAKAASAAMGKRSHSTIITAAKRIEKQIEQNPLIDAESKDTMLRVLNLKENQLIEEFFQL